MKLTWGTENKGKDMFLFLGDQEHAVAHLQRAKVQYSCFIDLPGVVPDKKYASLQHQVMDAERKVRQWFEQAWADAPTAEVTYMAEIRWDNKLISPVGALRDASDQIEAGHITPDKLLVLCLNTKGETGYDVNFFVSNASASELVTLSAYGQSVFMDYLRGDGA